MNPLQKALFDQTLRYFEILQIEICHKLND